MDSPPAPHFDILLPDRQTQALVFASPHSGRIYPPAFLAQSALDADTLRRSEDTFVDELFGSAPALGAPLIRAQFPRAYLDLNRGPYELDPLMFDSPLPPYVTSKTSRVAAGLGTIARFVSTGAEIYKRKLSFAEVEERIQRLYHPYHAALSDLLDKTMAQFGCCLLIDCHSMPSTGGPNEYDAGLSRVDFVLGDCFGASCTPAIVRAVESFLRGKGYVVAHNVPYAGGFTTAHYGRPAEGRHALQIEINRQLYMDEATHRKGPDFSRIQTHLNDLIIALSGFSLAGLHPATVRPAGS